MAYRLAADVVVALHLSFIVFMAVGGFMAWRWRWVPWIHLPLVAWGAAISVLRFRCPLTPLEIHLRELAGQSGYDGGFIDHYIMAIIYPSGLTPTIQLWMAIGLVTLNVVAYGVLSTRRHHAGSVAADRAPSRSPDSKIAASYTRR
ncbi:MAG: DUF2784 domain-containing protein [Acidimicrobiales bacterium]